MRIKDGKSRILEEQNGRKLNRNVAKKPSNNTRKEVSKLVGDKARR